VHQAKGFVNYSSFSLWDTFRATHPLLTITDQKHTAEFANSLISRHTQAGGTMPMWELCGFDNQCMIGYHSSSMIWDAIAKNITGISEEEAFKAMYDAAFVDKKSSSDGEGGLSSYIKYNYIPYQVDKSVAKTLEFAYCDWTVAQLAKRLGKTKEAQEFNKRVNSFENLWDADKNRFWMKDEKGNWHKDFPLNDWKTLQPHYVSGNFWAYEYFVPHNMERFVELRGGKDGLEKSLDGLFSESIEMVGDQHVDISGFIGMYGHGDEPGHHIPYLYNYTNSPWKSQEIINTIRNTMYSDKPDGMINNEDCGQMSAWYIFSSLGFYPVCPGKPIYDIGTPMWEKAEIRLENGNTFTITANNVSKENIYVKSIKLNGKKLDGLFLKHEEIMKGGEIVFKMSSKP
ncbi:MAG: glycoside hydrolase family 92 protein, partial [Firmicutes bacterium]|nr:glycoside hydrolase family 92 protein [Bacillota bacterium]